MPDSCIPEVISAEDKYISVEYRFSPAIKSDSEWIIPAVGQVASIKLTNYFDIPSGPYLWSIGFGYLKVSAFDPCRGLLLITNDGNGGVTPGVRVPRGTLFILTPKGVV